LVESDDFSAKADFRVLGTLAASVNGHPVRLGGPRQIAVLAMLITSRGAVVPADRLASEAWENLRPPTPTTLHVYVSKLRKALEPERLTRAPGRLLTREGSGYALRIDPSQVDSERFTELALKGRQALEDQRFEEAHALLTKSLKLWRGPAYADVADMSFALPEIARLTELHVTAREDSLAALIELGRHDIAVGSLDALVSEQPLRERAWELLCLALYRSGRQADALAALRTIRQRLAEDLGIDPSPTLRDLEAAILEQDPALDKPKLLRTSAYVTPTGSERGKKPPSPLTRLIGRADELGSVQDLLAEHRMVTLVGPGGVGKTRLALELTRMRCDPEGPFYVDLLAISTPDLLVSTLVEALGVPGATCFEQMAAALDGQKALLVLDNCEHLLPDIAVYASRMLGSLEGLRVLATSREPLGLVGEAVFDVQPLDPQTDGAELFQQRAAAVLPTWHPQEAEVASIQRICDELDGIPLAIELAAAQCRLLSVEEIQHALDDRFSLLIAPCTTRSAGVISSSPLGNGSSSMPWASSRGLSTSRRHGPSARVSRFCPRWRRWCASRSLPSFPPPHRAGTGCSNRCGSMRCGRRPSRNCRTRRSGTCAGCSSRPRGRTACCGAPRRLSPSPSWMPCGRRSGPRWTCRFIPGRPK
jgi:DNA-binding SARP family transcriptional activator